MKFKTVFWWIVISIVVIVCGKKAWSYFSGDEKIAVQKPIHHEQRADQPLTPEAEPPTPADPEEWTQTHSTPGLNGSIRDWFIPATTSNPTDWFKMAGYNTGFRVFKNPVLVEFKSASNGDITKVYLDVSKNIFYKAPGGIISDKQYPEEEFAAIRKDAESVRFLEVNGKPLTIKAWRTE